MPNQQPKLTLTFAGEGFRHGAVPLTVVAAKLQALQQAMFHAAAAAAGHRGGRRGQWFNRFRSAAELTFATSHHSDLAIETELAADPVLSDEFDVGQKAIDLLFDVAVAVDENKVLDLPIDALDRDYLVRALEGLMPNAGDQYQITLENCRAQKHPRVVFTSATRSRLRGYAALGEESLLAEEEVTIVGELVKIHLDAGEDKITVRWQRRNIDCFYGDALRDQVANLIAGSIVEVTGLGTLNDRGEVAQVRQVTSVGHQSTESLRIGRFEHGGRVILLAHPIPVDIDYTDGLWVYHHAGLNLWGYADRREKALEDLHADFIDLYTHIAEEDPGMLEEGAQALRAKLKRLVLPEAGVE